MHTIILVEQYKLNNNGDLEVTAILENEQRDEKGTYLFRAPGVAPIRAKATIYRQTLPPGVSFQGKGTKEWTEMIDRYQLFLHQEMSVKKMQENVSKMELFVQSIPSALLSMQITVHQYNQNREVVIVIHYFVFQKVHAVTQDLFFLQI